MAYNSLYMVFETKHSNELVDFMSEWEGIASAESRAKVEKLITAYDDGKCPEKAELAQAARELAKEIWPVRYALNRFFAEEGALIEWDRVEQAVRRSTAHLMEQFKENTACTSLGCVTSNEDFEAAFREEERHEIESVRHHLREDYWKTHPKTLAPLVDEAKEVVAAYEAKFDELKKISEGWPSLLAEEVLSKIASFEDRIYLQGEHISLEVIDQEVAYYREQRELPIEN